MLIKHVTYHAEVSNPAVINSTPITFHTTVNNIVRSFPQKRIWLESCEDSELLKILLKIIDLVSALLSFQQWNNGDPLSSPGVPGGGGLLGGSAGSGVDPSLVTSNNESCDQLQNAAAVSTNTEGSSSQQLEKDDGQKSEVTNTEKALVVSIALI